MNLLLDTHIWLWGLLEPDRIAAGLRDRLRDPGNLQWLSPISVWETLVLAARGRLRIRGSPESWVEAALASRAWHEAPLTIPVAIASRSLTLDTSDPADHFLAATALVHGFTLVTADRVFLGVPDLAVLAP